MCFSINLLVMDKARDKDTWCWLSFVHLGFIHSFVTCKRWWMYVIRLHEHSRASLIETSLFSRLLRFTCPLSLVMYGKGRRQNIPGTRLDWNMTFVCDHRQIVYVLVSSTAWWKFTRWGTKNPTGNKTMLYRLWWRSIQDAKMHLHDVNFKVNEFLKIRSSRWRAKGYCVV